MNCRRKCSDKHLQISTTLSKWNPFGVMLKENSARGNSGDTV